MAPIYNQKAENQQRDILIFSSQIMYSVPRFLKNYVRSKKRRLPAIRLKKIIEKEEFCVFQKGTHWVIIITIIIAHMNFLTTNTYQ